MHEEADHCCVDQSTDRQCAEEDHRAEPARDQTGEASSEPGSVTRIIQTPARLASSPPTSRITKTNTATTATSNRYALANQLPNRKPKTLIAVRSGG